jgi:kinesin family protein 2/24
VCFFFKKCELIKNINHVHSFSGRVHSAMVSKLNPAQRSVTVEWYERGETKGKEVELDMLLALNPELIQQTNKPAFAVPQPINTALPTPINLQRVSIVIIESNPLCRKALFMRK